MKLSFIDANGTPVTRTEMFYDDPSTTANLKEGRVWASTKAMPVQLGAC
ncbi:MAG: hypothetical protein WBD22_07450 [Pyrinomonadaceae bacterium]